MSDLHAAAVEAVADALDDGHGTPEDEQGAAIDVLAAIASDAVVRREAFLAVLNGVVDDPHRYLHDAEYHAEKYHMARTASDAIFRALGGGDG